MQKPIACWTTERTSILRPENSLKNNFYSAETLEKYHQDLAYSRTMKISHREGGFRCKTPRSSKALIVFIQFICIILNGLKTVDTRVYCESNEMQQCNNSNCTDYSCVKCFLCPPGQGLKPQCTGTTALKGNMTMECSPCKDGMYSDKRDFGSCQSCNLCVGQEILQKCNATHNAICMEGCKNGFQWDPIYGLCQPVYVPTAPETESTKDTQGDTTELPTKAPTSNVSSNNGSSEPLPGMKETTSSPSPKYSWISLATMVLVPVLFLFATAIGIREREKIFTFLRNVYCSCRGHSSMDQGDTCPMHQDSQEQELSEIRSVPMNRQSEEKDPLLHIPGKCSDTGTPKAPDPQELELKEVISSPPEQPGIAQDPQRPVEKASPTSPLMVKMVDQDCISSPCVEQHEKGVDEAIAMFDNPDLQSLLLKDCSLELLSGISVKISDVHVHLPVWKEIGRCLEITKHKIKEFETRCSYGSAGGKIPGDYLLDVLESKRPDLTVKEFMVVLKTVKSYDVICDIHNYYCKNLS